MHKLKKLLAIRIAEGLQHSAITTCSQWARKYRKMGKPFPGPLTFKYHPWTKDMHDCTAERMIGQKSAQAGFTDTAINKMFYSIDIKGNSCLYILPTEENAQKFSASRFDPAIELSEHLSSLFTNTKNVGHKRAGSANLFIRGSKSENKLVSDPVALMVFDEVDRMYIKNIPLALERLSGQVEKQAILISTPTIEGKGINAYFQQSTQDHFFFKCPYCSRHTELVYPESIVITAEEVHAPELKDTHIICKECKHILPHETKTEWLADGFWVSTYEGREVRGFWVNQLYSSTVKPYEFAESKIKAQYDPTDEQEFYNSKQGLPHTVKGAAISDADIQNCYGIFKKYEQVKDYSSIVTMGVDVGTLLHYEIDRWIENPHKAVGTDVNSYLMPTVIDEGTVEHFEQLDELIQRFKIHYVVIDANPERRKATEFSQRFEGMVKMCFYGNNISGKDIKINNQASTITVDRTNWLDTALGRFRDSRIILPIDLSLEYRNHIKEPVRVYLKDSTGNPVGRYVNSKDDHFAHARTYSEIALPLAVSMSQPTDISGIF